MIDLSTENLLKGSIATRDSWNEQSQPHTSVVGFVGVDELDNQSDKEDDEVNI